MKIFKICAIMLLILSGCTTNNNKCGEKGCSLNIIHNYDY